ncbi:MAG: hypothetical protein AABZ19_00440 [Pseudomonadota bacterium]|uniref:hypothetical protein n=1 Tax=Aquabacterium sp. TaxID=1872578 RepID=UPI001D2A7E01|nr:hypothetical protein [Aquabacterium sp.]MBT9611480.1 hypothetical protein [Aquabacterium sp.]
MSGTSARPPAQQSAQQALRAAFLAPAMRTAQWNLPMGAAAVPLVHRAAQVLMGLSALMAWVWALAAVASVWPLAFAVGWTWHVARLWRAWGRPPRTLLLSWQSQPLGAWQVAEWGECPVHVRTAWDGQAAFLLHLRAADGAGQAWLWVRDDGGRDIHRLRTLLGVPPATPEAPVA